MSLNFAVLRNEQGIYAPLHLKCELDVANRVNAVLLRYFLLNKLEEVPLSGCKSLYV